MSAPDDQHPSAVTVGSSADRCRPGVPAYAEVLVLGGGPAGLETALALRTEGFDVQVLEAGTVGESLRRWGHVRMFSPWSLNTSALGLSVIESEDIQRARAVPTQSCPTGAEFVRDYLEPIARSELLAGRIHERVRALGATRRGTLKGELIGAPARRSQPFRVVWESRDAAGRSIQGSIESRILVDATGVHHNPNSTGDGGVPAPGEDQVAPRIRRDLAAIGPDSLVRLRGHRVLVVGGGYSAATACAALADAPDRTKATEIHWAFRASGAPIATIDNDPLAQRSALRARAQALAADPPPGFTIHSGVSVVRFARASSDAVLVALRTRDGAEHTIEVDDVLSLTGYRPNPQLLSELQVHHCYATDGLMKVSAHLLGSGAAASGDCLSVSSGGMDTLRSPEADLFVLGSKSYGRSSQYLLRTGIEQAQLIAAELRRAPSSDRERSARA